MYMLLLDSVMGCFPNLQEQEKLYILILDQLHYNSLSCMTKAQTIDTKQ